MGVTCYSRGLAGGVGVEGACKIAVRLVSCGHGRSGTGHYRDDYRR